MATLIRLAVGLLILAVIGAVAMWALATFVEPKQRDIVIEIPLERLGL